MLFSLKLDFLQGTVFTMLIYLSSSPMDGSLQLICRGSVKNGANSSYCSPSWGLSVVCFLCGGNDKQHYKKDLSVAGIPGALGECTKRCY